MVAFLLSSYKKMFQKYLSKTSVVSPNLVELHDKLYDYPNSSTLKIRMVLAYCLVILLKY